jgi:hypothetical protein
MPDLSSNSTLVDCFNLCNALFFETHLKLHIMKKLLLLTIALFALNTTFAQGLRIVQVIPSQKTAVIKNFSGMTVNISTYQFCSMFNYTQLGGAAITVVSGSLNLTAGSIVTVSWNTAGGMNINGADLCLYQPMPTFSNPAHMIDFVQWGSAGNGRENVAQAAGLWQAGTFVGGNGPMSFDGDPSAHGVQFWQLDCINPALIGSLPFCPLIYNPVCGCDGVTYDNDCYAQTVGGVTSWTPGLCSPLSGECEDLAGLDFGMCFAVVGTGVVNGQCVTISGCGPVANGIDYSPSLYDNLEECQACLGIDCIDESQIDLEMGCSFIYNPVCGCDGVTYANDCIAYYYGGVTSWTPGECEVFSETCANLAGIDFGACALFLGYGKINGVCTPISGCGYIVDGVNYSPAIFSTEEECNEICEKFATPCSDLAEVDFGPCDMMMGFGVVNGNCQSISGCGSWVDGIEYSQALYENIEDCQACLDCINPDQIDPGMFCIEIFDPVCGCDNVTYSNDCYAYYYGGVTSWTPGACVPTGIETQEQEIRVFVSSANTINVMFKGEPAHFTLFDVSGRVILQEGPIAAGNHAFDSGIQTAGIYLYSITSENRVVRGKVYLGNR